MTGYRGSAKFYDLFALGKEEEMAFYRLLAQEVGSPALELGSGTGLFSVLLAKDGIKVVGLEKSPEMLNEARRKLQELPPDVASRLLFLSGDMSRFQLNQQFRLIFVPSASFQYMKTPEDQLSCLQSVRAHLDPNGLFVFDIWLGGSESTGAWRRLETMALPDGGAVTRSISTRYRESEKIVDTVLRFDVHDEAGQVLETFFDWGQLAILSVEEVRHLIRQAGLQIESIYANFNRQPFSPESDRAIFVVESVSE